MSDLSIEGAATAAHLEKIMAELGAVWEMMDGPPTAFFYARRKQYHDLTIQYDTFAFSGPVAPGSIIPTVPKLGLLAEIFSHAVYANAVDRSVNAEFRKGALYNIRVEDSIYRTRPEYIAIHPDTCKLVWRSRPEIQRVSETDGWALYARLAFMPKDAWILEVEE